MAHLKKLIQFIKWRVKLHIHSALIWNGCLIFFITFWKIKFNRLDFGVGVFNAYFDLGIFSLKTKAHNVKFICDGHPINPPIFFQRINLFDIVSVTRWLYYCFNIWPFRKRKFCPKVYNICQRRFTILPNAKLLLKKCPKKVLNFAQMAKFRHIWSHWTLLTTLRSDNQERHL